MGAQLSDWLTVLTCCFVERATPSLRSIHCASSTGILASSVVRPPPEPLVVLALRAAIDVSVLRARLLWARWRRPSVYKYTYVYTPSIMCAVCCPLGAKKR